MAEKVVKISMRGLAEVAHAAANRKTTVLKKYKFPESEESIGRSNYYSKTLSAVRHHHKGEQSKVRSILLELLHAAAVEENPLRKAKLMNNYHAINAYLKKFGKRNLQIKPGRSLHFLHQGLSVSAKPDLVAEENGRLVLIKINFGKKELTGLVAGTMLHLLYESANRHGLKVDATSVECLQVASGSRSTGPKSGFPDQRSLFAACREVLNIWDAA